MSYYSFILFLCFFLIQCILPLRHYYYHYGINNGGVNWTGNGELFSWRMMLTSKECYGYYIFFNNSSENRTSNNRKKIEIDSFNLTRKQKWRAFQHIDYTIQLAQFIIQQEYNNEKGGDAMNGWKQTIEIYAIASCSLNGNHPEQQCINSSMNLLNISTTNMNHVWLPLEVL
jgi:hypothetical protein